MTANTDTKQEIEAVSSFVFNFPLAESLFQSIDTGLRKQSVHYAGGNTAWCVFKQSLDVAVKDIKDDPRGLLFKRLIRYGPHTDTVPHEETLTGDGKTILSDPEWGKCVEFIFSYMINRFKGELAELLGVQPCLKLMEKLEKENRLPGGGYMFIGEMPFGNTAAWR